MNTLYILGCGAQKLDHVAPAERLYTGSLFRATLTHARRFECDENILILSAKHGLLRLTDEIEPYDVQLDTLHSAQKKHLVGRVARQICSHYQGVYNPLRIIALAGASYIGLLKNACALPGAWPSACPPIRAPLAGLPIGRQRGWLFSHLYPTMCEVELPDIEAITPDENERLRASTRAAALWWAGQLMRDAPPPEPGLLADALALEIWREWPLRNAKARDWPEALTFPVTFHNAPGGLIGNALRAIGLDEGIWWKWEWRDRRLEAWMKFSMDRVSVQIGDVEKVIFQT